MYAQNKTKQNSISHFIFTFCSSLCRVFFSCFSDVNSKYRNWKIEKWWYYILENSEPIRACMSILSIVIKHDNSVVYHHLGCGFGIRGCQFGLLNAPPPRMTSLAFPSPGKMKSQDKQNLTGFSYLIREVAELISLKNMHDHHSRCLPGKTLSFGAFLYSFWDE